MAIATRFWDDMIWRVHRKFGGRADADVAGVDSESGLDNDHIRIALDEAYGEVCKKTGALFSWTTVLYTAGSNEVDLADLTKLDTGKPSGDNVKVLRTFGVPRWKDNSGNEYNLVPMDTILSPVSGEPYNYRLEGKTLLKLGSNPESGRTLTVGILYRGEPRDGTAEDSTSPTWNDEVQEDADAALVALTVASVAEDVDDILIREKRGRAEALVIQLKNQVSSMQAHILSLRAPVMARRDYFGGW